MLEATERGLSALGRWTLRRPGLVMAAMALMCLLAGVLAAARLGVSTSRTGLVSEEHPDQVRLNRFFERFGRPDAPTLLIRGSDPDARRAMVVKLQAALEEEPVLAGRVLGRITPQAIAPLLLLQRPDALVQLRQAVGPAAPLPELVESGLVGWMEALATTLEAGLAGQAGVTPPDPSTAAAGLRALGSGAAGLSDYLAGGNPLERWVGAGDAESLRPEGVDEHGFLVTGSRQHHLVVMYPELASDEGADLKPLVTRIRAIRDEVMAGAPAGVTADLTGLPAIIVDELAIVQEGLETSTVLATLGILVLCAAMFRSLGQTIIATLPLLPGVVLTLGATYLIYGHLNLITSSFVAVLLGLGIDFSVHLVSRFNEFVRAGMPRDRAAIASLVQTGPGIFVGATITAVGFLAGLTTEFTAYGELGVITAVGLLVVMGSTFLLVPPLLGRTTRATPRPPAPEPPGMAALARAIRGARGPILVVALISGVFGVRALGHIEFNPRYFSFLPETSESGRALVAVEYDPIASPVFANFTTESIEDARVLTERLRQDPAVAGVQSPSDLVPALGPEAITSLRRGFAEFGRAPDPDRLAHRAIDSQALRTAVVRVADALDEIRFAVRGAGLDDSSATQAATAFAALGVQLKALDAAGAQRLAELHGHIAALLGPALATAQAVAERGYLLPRELPPLFARRFAAKDGSEGAAVFAVPAGDFWQEEVADHFSATVRAIDPDVSGLALNHVAHGQMILAGFKRAAVIAAVLILVVLVVDLRSFSDALLALLPTALGWAWMLGLMALFGLRFDVANIVTLPLVLGVGIAYGVHMMHRLREGRAATTAERPGDLPLIDDVVRGTGSAVVIAALTTAVGFAALTPSDYGAMRSLGWVMVLGIGACLMATLIVLPAVLVGARKAR